MLLSVKFETELVFHTEKKEFKHLVDNNERNNKKILEAVIEAITQETAGVELTFREIKSELDLPKKYGWDITLVPYYLEDIPEEDERVIYYYI